MNKTWVLCLRLRWVNKGQQSQLFFHLMHSSGIASLRGQLFSQSIWSVRVIFAISLNKKCMSFKAKTKQSKTNRHNSTWQQLAISKGVSSLDSLFLYLSQFMHIFSLLSLCSTLFSFVAVFTLCFSLSLSRKNKTIICTYVLQYEYQLWPIEFACG